MADEYRMDLLLKRLSELTFDMVESADELTTEKVEQFIEIRESLCHDIGIEYGRVGLLNPQQKQLLTHILNQDILIRSKFESLRTEALEWLDRNQKIRNQRNAYDAVGAYDSMFIDFRN